MGFLLDLSVLWAMLHIAVLFLLLFRPRSPGRAAAWTVAGVTLLFTLVNTILFLRLGPDRLIQVELVTYTLPSLVFYWFFSKYRDGRFFFTYCFADTTSFWIMQVTNLLDRAFGNTHIVMLAGRIFLFLGVEYLLWSRVRKIYHRLQDQEQLSKSWWLFTAVTLLFYAMIIVMAVPVGAEIRSISQLVSLSLLMILMPVTYLSFLTSMTRQLELAESRERERMLEAQSRLVLQRAELTRRNEEAIRIERHDLRHRLQTISSLIEKGDDTAALEYIGSSQHQLDGIQPARYCANPILDAVLSSCLAKAGEAGISVETRLAIPEELPVDPAELSTVFANALENAVAACGKLPEGERKIVLRCVNQPRFLFEIANTCAGDVAFGGDGLPEAAEQGHGMGTRSIAAFAQKHGALFSCRAEDGWFRLRIAL